MLSCYSDYPSKNFFNGEFKMGFISIQNCGDLGFENDDKIKLQIQLSYD